MKNKVGRYRGVDYKLQRICDVLAVDCKEHWYFIYDDDGEPTGDHYRTITEMKRNIDNIPEF